MRAALVRLYPRSWRDRYGVEFEAMLEEQRATLGAVADVVLGAVDAHLTKNAPESRGRWLHLLPGLLLTFGALIWTAAQGFNVGRPWDQQSATAIQIATFSLPIVGVGILAESSFRCGSSRLRWVGSAIPTAGFLALAAGYLISMYAFLWLPYDWAIPLWRLTEVLVVGGFVAQLIWAVAMAVRVPAHRLATVALAVAVSLNFTVGHVVWEAAIAPGDATALYALYPPDLDRFIAWLVPASWTLIGLSVLWPRRSRVPTAAS